MRVEETTLNALKSRKPGHTLPRALYVEPDAYRLDLEHIFYKQWLFVGHDGEMPRPGDYITAQIGAYPVLVVRDRAGDLRAFHNTCRHRGSRICSAHKGSAVRLVCPYHKWSYDLDGRLLFARDMAKPFDAQALGLKPLACESANGYVFVCLADAPPDFAPFRAAMTPYFAPHDLSHAKVAFESRIVENGNWKLVWENNRECYHCTPNHPELCRSFPEAPTVAGVHGAADDPEIAAHWARMEAAGLPSGFTISADGQYRLTRMPLIEGTSSYTMSGQPAVKRGLSDRIAAADIGALMTFHYPSLWNHVLGDHAVSFRVLPVGPMQTEVVTRWLVHPDAVEGVDYSLAELTEVWLATNDQDRRIVEENQIGVASPAFEPGPYNPLHESGVIQFVDWYAEALARGLEMERRDIAGKTFAA
jgi:Rieske 2Fe-2S family protein